ncbi:CPBP family intramembrane glutamic endopeptidase [Oceanobacillus neutriphilus]|uniref:CPBP family intramembrane glutamic endopeptidase n=1 Tax=Oceanobacillus neutriphilus TaxID=531815 RepID=UPI001663D900|nr:type II CAAX endopeptidase family protein [Oceanobacillus neutriphilus]
MNVKKLGQDISTTSLLIYIFAVAIIFSAGAILNTSYYLYPNVFRIISAFLIILISFLYKPTRKLYTRVLDFSVMKKISTYFWIVLAYLLFYYLNHIFFKYGFFMNEELVSFHSLGIRYTFISFPEFLLYLLNSCLLIPIWEELVNRVCAMIFLTRFIPVWSGVIVQAVIFALLHIDKPVLTGFFALISFFLWYKTKSIIPSMILHSLYNIHGGLVTFYNFDFVPRW